MTSLQLVLSENKTDFTTNFNPSINLNQPCELALINLETYYSIPNIKPGFDSFKLNKGENSHDITLKTGSFSLVDINRSIEAIFDTKNLKNTLLNYMEI